MLQFDFESSMGYWLMTVARDYERAVNAALLPRGITWRQAQVLGWLAFEGDLSQSDLAERMNVEAPTLVGILDRMERDGWICRHDCATDRRKKIIRATERAEPAWAEVLASAHEVRTRAAAGLSDEQRQTLMTLLRQVQQNLREADTVGCVSAPAKAS